MLDSPHTPKSGPIPAEASGDLSPSTSAKSESLGHASPTGATTLPTGIGADPKIWSESTQPLRTQTSASDTEEPDEPPSTMSMSTKDDEGEGKQSIPPSGTE